VRDLELVSCWLGHPLRSSTNSEQVSPLVISRWSRARVQVAVVGDGLDALGVRDYVFIAGHHDHGAELQALARCMVERVALLPRRTADG
jgi:hypothetical protein